jgi:quercetin dioxygenase-like cupin family protein
MDIKRVGSRSSVEGPEDWFTGRVRIDFLFEAHEPARAAGASVTFEPGPGRRGTPTRSGRR